jgi:hypothetical protein
MVSPTTKLCVDPVSREKAFPLDGDGQHHGISCPNPCNSLKRNHEGVSCEWCVGILVGRQAILDVGCRFIVEVVFALQVEEPLAHMAANVRLVAVEAQPLTATFLLLGRRQATKLAHGRGCDGPLGRWRHGPDRGRGYRYCLSPAEQQERA